MNLILSILLVLATLGFSTGSASQVTTASLPDDTHIIVSPTKILNTITPWMYGSCIEDVNHEIYGGLYAQRIFGESFEEPPNSSINGWTAYGGDWNLSDGALHVGADAGAKLVRQGTVVGDGTVACDVRFADASGDNAGLILRVSDPHTGPDPWIGYEISLSAHNRTLILGRHRHNWELLKGVPATVSAGVWHRLRVEMKGTTLRIYLDESVNPLIEYTDEKDFLAPGFIGVRTWNSQVAFRHLTITVGTKTISEGLDGSEQNRNGLVLSRNWDPIVTGSAKPGFVWDSSSAYNSLHSQQILHRGGVGTVGIANRGLNRWGIAVQKGNAMQGHLYVRCLSKSLPFVVALQSADGSRIYAQQRLTAAGGRWTRYDFRLLATATDPSARFGLWLERPGGIAVDQVYLSNTGAALFKGGVFRADIGNALVKERLTFLRYGGTMVNAPQYRWKQMIGNRDKRPQYRGHWYPYSTNGFGIEEFLKFCEAAHIEPAFAINCDETPEDAADLVEYLNGPVASVWGAKRAANGHPKPYNVHYIEIGNEEGLDGNPDWYQHYLERFKLLYATMHSRDPSVKYVIAAWWNAEEPLCKQIAQELGDKAALWDVHVDADNLRDGDRVDHTLTRMQELFNEWIPGSPLRACIFEENGNRHDLQRALGHALILNVAQRHGDFVQMDCPANCLQPMGQNDNGWDQGQVFFLPDKVWGMPPYYAQQMAAQNHLPLRVDCETTSPDNDLDVTATTSKDHKTLVLEVVNSGAVSHNASVQLIGFVPADTPADTWTLSGDLTAVNTPDSPEHVRSVHSRRNITGSSFSHVFEPYSYTILRLRQH
jgi:alpha-L-arabinofuranosidase